MLQLRFVKSMWKKMIESVILKKKTVEFLQLVILESNIRGVSTLHLLIRMIGLNQIIWKFFISR